METTEVSGTGMTDELSEKIAQYIKKMPSFSTTVSKVLEICDNIQASPAALNQVISLDPVLVGRVLRLINSAYYGLNPPVTSLVRAIIMLGLNTVKNLALSSAAMASVGSNRGAQGLNMEAFWLHSLCAGVAAKVLARKRGVDSKQLEEYFTAGLLHDIGKIPLNAVLEGEYMCTVSAADRERIGLDVSENRILGMDHCAAGAMIVAAWRLKGAVGDAIIHHHRGSAYEGPWRDVVFTTVLANRFASVREIGFSGDRYPEKIDPAVFEYLRLDPAVLEEIEPEVDGEIEKARIFLYT
ncbi:MAG: HDOD domain-containing protein [Treponema sp.]|jgi:HD-like signal output (HDOD) protein|nr:HDOD domain-containing protein [Treponema sp.]